MDDLKSNIQGLENRIKEIDDFSNYTKEYREWIDGFRKSRLRFVQLTSIFPLVMFIIGCVALFSYFYGWPMKSPNQGLAVLICFICCGVYSVAVFTYWRDSGLSVNNLEKCYQRLVEDDKENLLWRQKYAAHMEKLVDIIRHVDNTSGSVN